MELDTAKSAICPDNNFGGAFPAESRGAIAEGISPDPLSGANGSVTSPGKVLLSTVQEPVPSQGASHLSVPSCAERLGGISPQPMQADVERSANQPETASRLIKTNWCDDVKSYNFAIYRFKEYIRKRED